MSELAIFCDFDGTIARRDVGYNFFRHFSKGENERLIPDWIAGTLSTRDCLLQEAAMVTIEDGELRPFLDQFALDPGFASFVRRCGDNRIALIVISDGLDFYIRHILTRHEMHHLPLIANKGTVVDGKVEVEFPFDSRRHDGCGVCKGERIAEYRRENPDIKTVVYVGDGYSDKCAATEADILFAKKDLRRYCDDNQIAYYSYDTFDDVGHRLHELGLWPEMT